MKQIRLKLYNYKVTKLFGKVALNSTKKKPKVCLRNYGYISKKKLVSTTKIKRLTKPVGWCLLRPAHAPLVEMCQNI